MPEARERRTAGASIDVPLRLLGDVATDTRCLGHSVGGGGTGQNLGRHSMPGAATIRRQQVDCYRRLPAAATSGTPSGRYCFCITATIIFFIWRPRCGGVDGTQSWSVIFSPDNHDQQFFHGEDTNLYSDDPKEFRARLHGLHELAPDRFRMVHFAGMQIMSLFPEKFGGTGVPWDFLEWKRKGMKVGYTMSGCNDGIRQSVYKETQGCLRKVRLGTAPRRLLGYAQHEVGREDCRNVRFGRGRGRIRS